jgi:hypothetical protein
VQYQGTEKGAGAQQEGCKANDDDDDDDDDDDNTS